MDWVAAEILDESTETFVKHKINKMESTRLRLYKMSEMKYYVEIKAQLKTWK